MVNQLDPLTTSPITPTPLKVESAADFASLKEQILQPYKRLTAADITPASATTKAVEGVWTDYDGAVAEAIGNSARTFKFHRIGQLVRVKAVIVQGTDGYAYDAITIALPYPPTDANGFGAFAIGTATSTEVVGGVRKPLWYAGGTVLHGGYLSKNPVFGGLGNYNGRQTITFLGPALGNPITVGEIAILFLKYHANV